MSPIFTPTTFYEQAEDIILYDLLFHLDAGNQQSYPGSGVTWTDLSGNGNTFTLTNGPTFTGSNGGAIVFDGTNDSADVSSLDIRRDHSLEIWVNFDADRDPQASGMFGQGPSTGTAAQLTNKALHIFHNSPTTINYHMYFNDFSCAIATTSAGQWYQYVFTYLHTSPYTKTIYRNGLFISSSVSGQNQYEGSGSFRIGQGFGVGTSLPLDGRVAIARGYTKRLTTDEVSRNFNANKARFGL